MFMGNHRIVIYMRPTPWRTMLRPWRRDTSCALLLLEAAASNSTAQSRLWAAAPVPLPTEAVLSIRSLACCFTAWIDNWRRTSPTNAESKAALDTCRLLTVGNVSSLSNLWYMGHTSMCQFHTEWSHFWMLMVTIDYDGVSTKFMIILMIELGIWVIRACANFIRSGPTFGG